MSAPAIAATRSQLRRLGLTLAIALFWGLTASPTRAADTVTLRLGTLLPSGTAQHTELKAMIEQWHKDAAGSLKVILYPDGRLGSEGEMVKKIRIKQLNAAMLTVVGLSEIDLGVTGLQLLPVLFRSWDEVDYVRERMRPMLEQRLQAKGYEVLFWADVGWVRFFSKEAGVHPDDFRKMKIFSWAGDPRQSEIMKAVGYRPIGLETGDIVMGLNTDMINVVPVPPLLALAGQLYGPAPHMLDLYWSPIVGATVVRSDVWATIPAELQAKLRATAEATGTKIRALSRREDTDAIEAMKTHGLKIHTPTGDALLAWEKLAEIVQQKERGTMVPNDIFDEVKRHLAEYRQSHPPTAK